MTTGVIAVPEADVARLGHSAAEAIHAAIRACSTTDQAVEARAQVAAAKAWAQAHGQLRDYRQTLLLLEVEALVKVVELGGAHLLSASERKAGEWLAGKTVEERRELVRAEGTRTSVSGLCRALWADAEQKATNARAKSAGIAWASGDRQPLRTLIEEVIDDRAVSGRPFDIEDVAECVSEDVPPDSALMEGVREVCRRTIRKAPTTEWGSTVIPKFITSRLPDGSFVRVPTPNARFADLLVMIDMRRSQLAQDEEALARLLEFKDRVESFHPDDDTLLGRIVAQTLIQAGQQ